MLFTNYQNKKNPYDPLHGTRLTLQTEVAIFVMLVSESKFNGTGDKRLHC